jgi:hypothetical protein
LYYALYKEVVWIHARWLEYRKLFAEKENVDLLNRNGAFAFKLIQDALWEERILHIARLTDRPTTAKRDNLSILRLPDMLPPGDLRDRVQALMEKVVTNAEFARDHRNKRIAHRDLQLATDPSAEPLSGVSRAQIEEVLAAIRDLFTCLEHEYRDTTVVFDRFVSPNDANQILAALRVSEA